MKKFSDIKWVDVILADTPDVQFYQFYKHYSEPFKVTDHNRQAITTINHWMEGDAHKGKGLILVGPELQEVNHLLFLTAQHMGFAIHSAADINEELFNKAKIRDDFQAAMTYYRSREYAVSFFGEEQGKEWYINDIIRGRWNEGKGTILATILSSEELKTKYGSATEAMLRSSSTLARIFKE